MERWKMRPPRPRLHAATCVCVCVCETPPNARRRSADDAALASWAGRGDMSQGGAVYLFASTGAFLQTNFIVNSAGVRLPHIRFFFVLFVFK